MKLTVPANSSDGSVQYTAVKSSALEANTDYMLSFDAIANKAFDIVAIALFIKNKTTMMSDAKQITLVKDTWTHYSLKLHTLASGFTSGDKFVSFWISADGRTAGTELSIVNLNL